MCDLAYLNDTNIGIAGEGSGPLYEGGVLQWARSDGVNSDCRVDGRVSESWLCTDCTVGDVVVNGRVFFLLDYNGALVLFEMSL